MKGRWSHASQGSIYSLALDVPLGRAILDKYNRLDLSKTAISPSFASGIDGFALVNSDMVLYIILVKYYMVQEWSRRIRQRLKPYIFKVS